MDIDEIISRAIPIPCKCTWETMKAQERREKLKEAIFDLLKKNELTLLKQLSDEDIGRMGTVAKEATEVNY